VNRIQKFGLAVIAASSMAFAIDPWWTWDAPYGQVAFPWVQDCQDDDSKFDVDNPDNVCFKTLGGWWFGYLAGPGLKPNVNDCRIDMAGKSPGQSTEENFVKAKINGTWVSFVGPDNDGSDANGPPVCNGPDVTNRKTGDSYLSDEKALSIQLGVGTGINGPDKWDPSIAALATNFSTPPGGDQGDVIPVFVKKDMSSFGGFCVKYESDHTAADNFTFTLGWDETDAETVDDRAKYDGWKAAIPAGTGVQTKEFTWPADFATSCAGKLKCGDFEQEGWSKTYAYAIDTAITKMTSIKFNFQAYTPKIINFKLIAFGPKGACGEATPIVPGKIKGGVNFTMEGKTLMASISKSAVVQIYNLRGAVVQSQTLTPSNNKMNLGGLPTGIYLVRAPSLGITSRIVVK